MVFELSTQLIPQPDETLSSYVLRTANEFSYTPLESAHLLGLSESQRCPAGFNLTLPAGVRSRLQRAVGRAVPDADVLALLPGSPDNLDPRSAALKHDLLVAGSRYCPLCLLPDDEEVEQPWLQTWRRPLNHTCIKHRVLLESHCPQCQFDLRRGESTRNLLPRIAHGGLPTDACRHCSTLEQQWLLSGARPQAAWPAAIENMEYLHASTPEARRDLWVLVCLLQHVDVEALPGTDGAPESVLSTVRAHQAELGVRTPVPTHMAQPALAVLSTAAQDLMQHPEELGDRLYPLLAPVRKTRPGLIASITSREPSATLTAALTPPPAQARHVQWIPVRRRRSRISPDLVPALLPYDFSERLRQHVDARDQTRLHRYLALALVQRAGQLSLEEAATALHMPLTAARSARQTGTRAARTEQGRRAFDEAIDDAEQRLAADAVNYGRLRVALYDYKTLTNEGAAELTTASTQRLGGAPANVAARLQVAPALAWAEATSGEWQYSPLARDAVPEDLRRLQLAAAQLRRARPVVLFAVACEARRLQSLYG